jgi:quercetin dioxygenase-like cupin family protein
VAKFRLVIVDSEAFVMQQWDLAAPNDSERTGPRVLFSTSEARGVVIDLAPDEEMGDHRVRERSIVHILEGSLACTSGAGTSTCATGTLIMFEPSETHSLRALEPTRLLLVLAPWPAPEHYGRDEDEDPHELPAHATQLPRHEGP